MFWKCLAIPCKLRYEVLDRLNDLDFVLDLYNSQGGRRRIEDVDWLELLDLISWTGAWRFCRGCIGFRLWFSPHPNVDACSLDCEKYWMLVGRQVGACMHVRKCSVLLLDETYTLLIL